MTLQDQKANELFFIHTLNEIHEYGMWASKDKQFIYKKVGNKLTANDEDLEYIKKIVSAEFYNKHFVKMN